MQEPKVVPKLTDFPGHHMNLFFLKRKYRLNSSFNQGSMFPYYSNCYREVYTYFCLSIVCIYSKKILHAFWVNVSIE